MAQVMDYANPHHHALSRPLTMAAWVSTLYPLWVAASLSSEWLVAWWVLGHAPRPSLDDPMSIHPWNALHYVTGASLMGVVPAILVATSLNTIALFNRQSARWGLIRLILAVGVWAAIVALLRLDPWCVLAWWLD